MGHRRHNLLLTPTRKITASSRAAQHMYVHKYRGNKPNQNKIDRPESKLQAAAAQHKHIHLEVVNAVFLSVCLSSLDVLLLELDGCRLILRHQSRHVADARVRVFRARRAEKSRSKSEWDQNQNQNQNIGGVKGSTNMLLLSSHCNRFDLSNQYSRAPSSVHVY